MPLRTTLLAWVLTTHPLIPMTVKGWDEMVEAMIVLNPINLEDLKPSDFETEWGAAKQTLLIYCEANDMRIEVVAFDGGDFDGPFEGAFARPDEPNRPRVIPSAIGRVEWGNIALLSVEHPEYPGLMCPFVSKCNCDMRSVCDGLFEELWEFMNLEDLLIVDWKKIKRGEAILGRKLINLPPLFAIYWGVEDDDADESCEIHIDLN